MKSLARLRREDAAPVVILFGGADTTGAHLKILFYGHPVFVTIVLIWVGLAAFSSWLVASRMRRRIKDDLGKNTVAAGDLTSIETWMKVAEIEENKHPGGEWPPKSSDSDYLPSERDL